MMLDYDELDPGIRDTVRLLNEAGFKTSDSGDGISKPQDWYDSGEAMPFKHVVAASTPESMVADAERLAALLGPEWNVEGEYQTLTKHAHLFARVLFPQELGAIAMEAKIEHHTDEVAGKLGAQQQCEVCGSWYVGPAKLAAPLPASAALQALIAQYRRIRACSPATPWCSDPSCSNADHYDQHYEAKDAVLERIFAAALRDHHKEP